MTGPSPAEPLPDGGLRWGSLVLPPGHILRARPAPCNYRVVLEIPLPGGACQLPPFDVRAASEPEAVARAKELAATNGFTAEVAVLVSIIPINRES